MQGFERLFTGVCVLALFGAAIPSLVAAPGLGVHSEQNLHLDSAGEIAAAREDAPGVSEAAVFGRTASELRAGLLEGLVPAAFASSLGQQVRNLDLAGRLSPPAAAGDGLREAIQSAQVVGRWQAASLGVAWEAPPRFAHASPSAALQELLHRHGIAPTSEQEQLLLALDRLPPAKRDALTGFVDAFLGWEEAARLAYAPASLGGASGLNHGAAPEPLRNLGMDSASLFAARNGLLDTVLEMRNAFAEAPMSGACTPVAVAPVFSLDLNDCDGAYEQDYALLFDAGGSDVYHNNAGGSGYGPAAGCGIIGAAAALVDQGVGDDQYGNPAAPRHCGANGGGHLGGGFLLDQGGNDTYTAGNRGTNGGVGILEYVLTPLHAGLGFLLDQGGSDTYTATSFGTNGGGHHGVGLLLDRDGDDRYTGSGFGTNGGGAGRGGIGFLLDQEGDDTYTATGIGTNGGGAFHAHGFLLDQDGDDTYTARHGGTNGGAYGFEYLTAGVGFLLDQGGDDTYSAGTDGANGGGLRGLGSLLDLAGRDTYNDASTGCFDCTVIPKGLVGAQVDR